jgi:hypothetical protein
MPRGNEDVSITRVAGEPRHWIEYGIFAFVFLTAIATAMAAWYTRRQWESAVDNGHRQLQAYVFPEQANLVWQGSAKPTAAEIVLKNSGQMPAYRLSTGTAILVSDHPLQSDLHFPAMPDNHTVIPPGSTALSAAIAQPFTGDQLKAIQKETQAIYVFGDVAYVDGFGECRMTRYQFYYTGAGAENASKVGLTYLDEGAAEVPCPTSK